MIKSISLCIWLLFAAQSIAIADIVIAENFDNIATLPSAGWMFIDNSSPRGTASWFQGNPAVFSAQAGAPDSYIAVNSLDAGPGAEISDWLISPAVSFNSNLIMTFYVRSSYPTLEALFDHLEVRIRENGAAWIGSTDDSLSAYELQFPSMDAPRYYPDTWIPFIVWFGPSFYESTCYGVPVVCTQPSVTASIALRYVVTDTSTNGDYIGIDSLIVQTPEPATIVGLATALVTLALKLRRK